MIQCTQLKSAFNEIKQLEAENSRLYNVIGKFHVDLHPEYCSALEQANRLLVACVQQYGKDGVLTLKLKTTAGVRLGANIQWCCTGRSEDNIQIKEV